MTPEHWARSAFPDQLGCSSFRRSLPTYNLSGAKPHLFHPSLLSTLGTGALHNLQVTNSVLQVEFATDVSFSSPRQS